MNGRRYEITKSTSVVMEQGEVFFVFGGGGGFFFY